MKDDNRNKVQAGDRITFSYGIPPRKIMGLVYDHEGELYVKTKGHNLPQPKLKKLRSYVGSWHKVEQ